MKTRTDDVDQVQSRTQPSGTDLPSELRRTSEADGEVEQVAEMQGAEPEKR